MAKKKNPFQKTRAAEEKYGRQLRSVANEVGKFIKRINPRSMSDVLRLEDMLHRYAAAITPWAQAKAQWMVEFVNRQETVAWREHAKEMSKEIRREIMTTPIGARMQELMSEQVDLITSIPRGAAERVHKLVSENLEQSSRGEHITKEILRTGEVTKSRATLIARTETSRVASVLTQARAEHVGSDGYIWRTVHDSDVRPSHKKMEGKFVKWSQPPTLDGLTGHAGALPNCRCYAEPVLPTN